MKIVAAPIALALLVSGAPSPDKATHPKIAVKANPSMAFTPARIVATADVTGGADDNEEFYCPSVQWEWGDGTKSEESADCDPYQPGKSQIKRHYTAEHTYTGLGLHTQSVAPTGDPINNGAGDYRIQFRLRRKGKQIGSGNTTVKVRSGIEGH